MRERIFNIIEISDNDNIIGFIYDKFMLICIAASIIPLCFKQTNQLFYWIEKITVVVFIADYILRLVTADIKYKKRGILSFIRYPFSLFAIIDLISILPSLSALNSGFKLFRLFRLNKAFKTLRLLRYSKSFNIIISVIEDEKKPLSAVCVLACGYILLSALIMFQVEPESFNTFFDAIYWAVVTLTTVGYGDIYPVSTTGRIISMLSSFVGIAIVALPTGVITAGYASRVRNNDK